MEQDFEDECFLNDIPLHLVPMYRFLESDKVSIHPMNRIRMKDFFNAFDNFCEIQGYRRKKQKYNRLWKSYGIKTGRGRFLYGISISTINHDPAVDENLD